MTNDELVLKVVNVKKQYRLGVIGGGTLQGDLQSWWARIRGKEDPNSKIGRETSGKNGTFMALRGVSFEVKKGERLGIIGGNGAGKSTTLKILSRVTAPTDGTIYIKGRISSMLEVGTGFHPELTGRENIYLNGAILGMSKSEVDRKIEDIIDFSECRQFIDTPVKRYSSGMYVKLAFSVAAHLDSEILIMDEVLAVGDMKFQQKCLNKMREVADNEGRTVLYVSHNMNTIRQLCNRCIVLNKGQVIYDGKVEEAIEIYLGSKENSSSVIDLFDLKRDPEFINHPITMRQLRALKKDSAVYDIGQNVQLEIEYCSTVSVNKVFFRLIMKTVDGEPITMLTNTIGFPVKQNKNERIRFCVDTSHLVPGRYTMSFVFYEVNEFGGSTNLDGLKDVYCFEITTVPGFNNNMEWQQRYWGNVYFAPLEIYGQGE